MTQPAEIGFTARALAPASLAVLALPALLLAAASVRAAPEWRFDGFGTLGLAHSTSEQGDFTINTLTAGDAGRSRSWSPNVDSRLGGRFGVQLDAGWSAVLQLVSERNLYHSYRPSVDWAYLQYQLTPDLSVRLGRITLPVFSAGDYRKAGYALPWARPPAELYAVLPVNRSDGVDATYRWRAAGLDQVTQVFYGHADTRITATARGKAQGMAGISHTVTRGAVSVRAGFISATFDQNLFQPLFAVMRQFGAQGVALADTYEVDHKRLSIASVGFNYDPGRWFLTGELQRVDTRSYLGDKRAAFVSAGYRAGDFTPYLSYATARSNDATSTAGLSLAGLPAQAAATAGFLNAALNGIMRVATEQHTASAGLRWDFQPGRALTLQYDRMRPTGNSTGTLINVRQDYQPARPIDIASVLFDFVF